MAGRPGRRGSSKIGRHLLAAGLTLSVAYTFGAFSLGGCGGSQPGLASRAGGPLPEHVVQSLRDCGERAPAPGEPEKHTVAFDVFMDADGLVEHVARRSSTLHGDEVEACMERALGALSERTAGLSLRRREPDAPAFASSEGRTLLGHPVAIAVGVAEAAVVVGLLYITVVVYYQVVRNTQTHRPPPPTPLVEDPPKPSEDPKPEPKATTGPTPPIPPDPPERPKPRPTCDIVFPDVVNCSYIQQTKYPDLKSALEAAIRRLPGERQKRPFSTQGTKPSDKLQGADHTTYRSADRRTKISIGCYRQCCKNTENGPVLEEGTKCYELNTEYVR